MPQLSLHIFVASPVPFHQKKKKWYLVTSIHLGMYFFFFDEMQ